LRFTLTLRLLWEKRLVARTVMKLAKALTDISSETGVESGPAC
jgi:hypothetical protein